MTLALAVVLSALWFNNPDVNGGFNGARVRQARLFGLDLAVGQGVNISLSFGLVCLAFLWYPDGALHCSGDLPLVQRCWRCAQTKGQPPQPA